MHFLSLVLVNTSPELLTDRTESKCTHFGISVFAFLWKQYKYMMRSTAQLAGKEVVLASSVRHSNLQYDVEGKRETDTVWGCIHRSARVQSLVK